MKPALIVGLLFIAAGIYIVAGQASYKTDREVLKIGGLEASVKESRAVPPWAGVIAIVAGGVMVFAGLRPAKT
jgi:hypothetical protein